MIRETEKDEGESREVCEKTGQSGKGREKCVLRERGGGNLSEKQRAEER